MPQLRAIIGLGNPGLEYQRTRHNAGFWFVDALALGARAVFRAESKFSGEIAKITLDGVELLLLKPMTYMNRSGEAAQKLAQFYKITAQEILVVHDEIDLPAGTVRLKNGGGHGGHNGLRSLHQHLGPEYLRLRIGVGHPGHKDQVHDYLTSGRPAKDEETAILASISDALAVLPVLLTQGVERAMHRLHSESDDKNNTDQE